MTDDGKLISEMAETLLIANRVLASKIDKGEQVEGVSPMALMQITVLGDNTTTPVKDLNEIYAGFVAGTAASLELTPEVYLRLFKAPVVPFSLNQKTAQIKNRLLIKGDAFRGCSDCKGLFILDNTSDAGRRTCSSCLRRHERDKKRAQRGTDLTERTCQVCGDAFTPKRSHAKVCSPKCRAKLSREKAKTA